MRDDVNRPHGDCDDIVSSHNDNNQHDGAQDANQEPGAGEEPLGVEGPEVATGAALRGNEPELVGKSSEAATPRSIRTHARSRGLQGNRFALLACCPAGRWADSDDDEGGDPWRSCSSSSSAAGQPPCRDRTTRRPGCRDPRALDKDSLTRRIRQTVEDGSQAASDVAPRDEGPTPVPTALSAGRLSPACGAANRRARAARRTAEAVARDRATSAA